MYKKTVIRLIEDKNFALLVPMSYEEASTLPLNFTYGIPTKSNLMLKHSNVISNGVGDVTINLD